MGDTEIESGAAPEGSEPTALPGGTKPRRPLVAPVPGRKSYRRTYGTLRVGSVLGRTIPIYARHIVAFSLISLIVHLPLFAYTWWAFDVPDPTNQPELQSVVWRAAWWAIVFLLGGMLLGHVAAGPVTYGVVERLAGRRAGIGACLAQGFRRLPRILGVAGLLTLYLIALGVVLVLMLIPVAGTVFGGGEGGQIGATLVSGLPALLLLSVFWVAVPVAVAEEKGSRGAMGRSSFLTSRNVWKIFAILLVFFVAEQGATRLIATALPEAVHIRDVRDLNLMVVAASALIFGPLRAVASAIGYHDLRTSSEGIDSAGLASVFD